jgi:hypothetical protein
MNWNGNVPFNWFDVFVLIMLLIGYQRGRKHGMSQEIIAVCKWVALVLACSIAYEPLGLWLGEALGLGKLAAFLLAYVGVGLVVALVFIAINRSVGDRLRGSDTFGKGEFYLAMPAGMLRFACIVVVLLALLNARFYTTAEVRAMTKYQNENYGSNFFPTLATVQDEVFRHSFLGTHIHKHLDFLLIKPTAPTVSTAARQKR